MGAPQGPTGYRGGRGRGSSMQAGGKQYALEADAALAVLQEQFPLYNQDSLTDVLKVLVPTPLVPFIAPCLCLLYIQCESCVA